MQSASGTSPRPEKQPSHRQSGARRASQEVREEGVEASRSRRSPGRVVRDGPEVLLARCRNTTQKSAAATSDETDSCSVPSGAPRRLMYLSLHRSLLRSSLTGGHQVKVDAEELQGCMSGITSLHRQRHHGRIRRAVRERTLFRLAAPRRGRRSQTG